LRRLVFAAILGVITSALGTAAFAQADYFGKNAVQWERLKFEVLKTDHFDIYYYEEEKKAAEEVARMCERWYERLSTILDYEFKDRQPFILYASQPHFQQTNTIGGPPGEGTGGVTESLKRRIVLPMGASLAETDHVVGHELVHAFQYAMTGQGRGNAVMALNNMPLWFVEGMAEYLSVGPIDAHTAMWMREATREKKLPSISDLESGRYFPYRWGQAVWAYIGGRFGDRVTGEALRKVGARTNDANLVLKQVLGLDAKELTKDWHAALLAAAVPAASGKKSPGDYGPALVTEKGEGGTLNVGPALSPGGDRVAFLSERDRFSIELFVADTKSGDITERLTKTAVDPHLESLQFIASAGAWDPTGQRFAVGAISKGRPLLVILDEKGKTLQEVPFPSLGQIATPSFSPDGNRVAFSAMRGGFSDLFFYDLASRTLTELTNDPFADLQPSWSPDGKTIAFATERFSTRLPTLDIGEPRLAAIDVATKEITELASFPQAKNINPQWSVDGRSLYFISDASGASNIYRVDVGTGGIAQVTDLRSGVTGITANSPALSVASRSGRVAYSVYEKGQYEIYAIDDLEKLAGAPARVEPDEQAGLIPGAQPKGRVLAAVENAQDGLPRSGAFTRAPYKASFALDAIGQPYAAAGISGGRGAFAGGISMQFSDMLGEHNLQTLLQAQSVQGFHDVGAIASYVNRQHRFNWGVQAGQIPYVSRSLANGIVSGEDGELLFAQQLFTQRQTERSVSALGIYPFDVATRVEVQAGFRHIGYDARLDSDFFRFSTGEFLGSTEQDIDSFDGVSMGFGTLALVRDTSLFGATSPILGRRFRIDVSPVVGTIDYTGVLADFRQYVMPVRPVTVAARVMHYGRYGSGGEDNRLYPLFLGDPGFVRGYGSGSFRSSECGSATGGACPVFDQLIGSRMLVGNVEVRAPLFGLFGAKNLYGPLPIEIGAFFDAGVAWNSGTDPTLFGGEREIVKSYGLVARLNLFGFLVLEADYARPLDRPGKKSLFQFNVMTGF
jgi:Tol biopolymer transport system component